MDQTTYGRLFLVPVTLGEVSPLEVLPLSVRKVVEMVDYYIVENEKTARRFIKSINPQKSQSRLQLSSINKFTQPEEISGFLDPCLQGYDMGLMSEAGVPGIADPGAEIVALAHSKNIRIQPLVGPSSILMAMMSSGLNGQNFAFNGYLPIEKSDRKAKIKALETLSRQTGQSQSFIETPYRNNKMIDELLSSLSPHTQLCMACDISLPTEFIKTQSVAHWKLQKPDLHKRPAIFIIQG